MARVAISDNRCDNSTVLLLGGLSQTLFLVQLLTVSTHCGASGSSFRPIRQLTLSFNQELISKGLESLMNHDSTDMNQMHEKETFIWEVHDFKKLLCV